MCVLPILPGFIFAWNSTEMFFNLVLYFNKPLFLENKAANEQKRRYGKFLYRGEPTFILYTDYNEIDPQIFFKKRGQEIRKLYHLSPQFARKQREDRRNAMMYSHVDAFMGCGFYDTAVTPLTPCYLRNRRVNRLVNHRHTSGGTRFGFREY